MRAFLKIMATWYKPDSSRMVEFAVVAAAVVVAAVIHLVVVGHMSSLCAPQLQHHV